MTIFGLIVVIVAVAAYSVITIVRLITQRSLHGRGQGIDTVALEERLARLEASVEGLGADTQRLTEGHRFFTQLLTNRPPAAAPITHGGDAGAKNGTA
jgi:hypothetical protein